MNQEERAYRSSRLGLAIKKIIDQNRSSMVEEGAGKYKTLKPVTSVRQLENSSGIQNSSLVQIISGRKNPSWSTVDAILEGLEMSLTQFAQVYDGISEKEVDEYRKQVALKKARQDKKVGKPGGK